MEPRPPHPYLSGCGATASGSDRPAGTATGERWGMECAVTAGNSDGPTWLDANAAANAENGEGGSAINTEPVLFWAVRFVSFLFSVWFCLHVHVAPAGGPA